MTGRTCVSLGGHSGAAVLHDHVVHPGALLARALQVHQADELQLHGGRREEGGAVTSGPTGCAPHPLAVLLTRKGRRRAPRRTVSTFQPPLLLLGACHTSSRVWPSTTTSARKPGGGGHHVSARPTPTLPQGALGELRGPRPGQRTERDRGTLGVTLKIVSHVEFTVGAGGAQRGCEDSGLRSQLPPGPLQGQEVPWGRARRLRANSAPRHPQRRDPP